MHAGLREPLAPGIGDERPGCPGRRRLGRHCCSTAAAAVCRPAAPTTSCWPSPPKARLDPGFSGHVLRHTFGTRLVRGGYDLVLVAELMGHARTLTTRGYATADDAQAAINSLPADR